ncbi:helix-turn-helix domain-containing protein [Kineococcus rubinsiae]|uniref:helix-turn-helix domain-containing protein n=1 Tax=Kineococcus rubinsiae TaxID=2609562 RepID=UPI00142F3F57|nr:helix-turn-helix domain-containing protein [Kineococcus rubinsiae]NIZ93722.1 helix-turn-helix domain-containing protein [Kineococcus rubinsiae]
MTAPLDLLARPEVVPPGLWVHRGPAPGMRAFHRHDDLEVNVVLAGRLEYLFGGARVEVPEGSTALFWAATPHRLTAPAPGAAAPPSDVCWVHLPLAAVLRWSLPERFVADVLTSTVLVVPTAAIGSHVEALFTSWQDDLARGGDDETTLLEAHALVRRVLATHHAGEPPPPAGSPSPETARVTRMAQFTAENFREPISPADIARAGNLTPNYATTLFRRTLGVTLGEHLVRFRVAEAQRLLVTTSMTTSAVAHAAGFGSQSSLYAQFTRACGCSPGAYRRALRAA